MIEADLHLLLPELILIVSAMALLMVGVFRGDKSLGLLSVLSVLAMAASAGAVLGQGSATASAFNGAFVADDFARFAKLLILLGSTAALALAQGFLRSQKIGRFEFPILILFATTGMMIMVSAQNFITFYMGLELQSLSLYVLAAFNRDSLRSSEAGLKYFVLGALSSGMLLYGISFIYGFTGSTGIWRGRERHHPVGRQYRPHLRPGVLHRGHRVQDLRCPIPHVDAGRLRRRPHAGHGPVRHVPQGRRHGDHRARAAAGISNAFHEWQLVIVVVSVLSMVLGAVAAIGQSNIKRLMAYSSIGHMGYALLGLAAGTQAGCRGCADLSAHLSRHRRGHLCLHPRDAARR